MQESLPHDTALVKGALRCVFRRTDAQAEVRFQSTFHDDEVLRYCALCVRFIRADIWNMKRTNDKGHKIW